MKSKLSGLIAAPYTPMHADGSIHYERIPALAKQLADNGVSGAFICGTTGEGQSMTDDERMRVAEAWRKAAPAGLKIIVQVGQLSLEGSKKLAAHAQKIKADAIASIAPSFFRPGSVDTLVDWCAGIAQAAPKLPFYFYHFPAITGVNFNMADFVPLALKKIPNFGGVKFTHENLMDFAIALTAADGRCDMLFGRDEILMQAYSLGAEGGVGSTYNYSAPVYQRMIKAYRAGDSETVLALQRENLRYIEILVRYGGLPAGKAIMGLVGIDCGPVRAPLKPLSKEQVAAMKRDLTRAGFFAAVKTPVLP